MATRGVARPIIWPDAVVVIVAVLLLLASCLGGTSAFCLSHRQGCTKMPFSAIPNQQGKYLSILSMQLPKQENMAQDQELEAPPTAVPEPDPEPDPATRQPKQQPPTNQQVMRALGTSPRRIVLSLTASTGIALAANFLGVTSRLLSAVPEQKVEATGLDTFYPVGDYKRIRAASGNAGYTLQIPKEWVADTTLELAKVQRRAGQLDYGMNPTNQRSTSPTATTAAPVLPDTAFGPPGRLNARGVSMGDTNVSVLVSNVPAGFSLRGTLGTPSSAAETYLTKSLAPPGSGRTAALVEAWEDTDRRVYQFEYTVDRVERGPPLRAISVIAQRNGDTLLTLTVIAPDREWIGTYETKLRKVASSFHLTH